MKTTMLLCDAAQECGGKLFILGAGWSIHRGTPVNMALAIKVAVPWDQANRRHRFTAILLTEDGDMPTFSQPNTPEQQQAVEFRGEFETGRPAGVTSGSDLDWHVAVNIGGVPLKLGRYTWRFLINDELVDQIPFSVIPAE